MNKISINLGDEKLDEISLFRGTLSIGRATDNDICLADIATSGHHAKIVTIFTSSFIQDLNSTNGTIVNDRKVVRHTLKHGDIITIGNMQLLFKSDTNGENEAQGSKRKIQIGKSKIQKLLQKSNRATRKVVNKTGKAKTTNTETEPAYSSESPTEPTEHSPIQNNHELTDSIPVLEEALPLSELRRTPDDTLVLSSDGKEPMKSESRNITENFQAGQHTGQNLNNTNDSAFMFNSDEDEEDGDSIEDEQIRQSLEQGHALTNNTRRLTRYTVISSILVIISIAIYLTL